MCEWIVVLLSIIGIIVGLLMLFDVIKFKKINNFMLGFIISAFSLDLLLLSIVFFVVAMLWRFG